MSADPAAGRALATLRQARAEQEAAHKWLRRLIPPLFAVVVAVTFTSGRAHGFPVRDVAAFLAVAGLGLAGLAALQAGHRRAAIRIVFAVVLLASSAALLWLQPGGAGLAGLLAGLVLLVPRIPDRIPIAVSVSGVACLAVIAVAVSDGAPPAALLAAIAIAGFPGMILLTRRLGQANHQAEQLLVELEETKAAQAQAARLAERQRLAREMHDVLAHSLSGLMLQLEGARMLVAGDPGDSRLPAAIERAHQLGKSGLDEARRAIGMLRDDELPGPELLAGLAAQFEEVSGVPCQFTVDGHSRELPADARLAVYRVTQEALTNITRHARPERVEVHLRYQERSLWLTVEDFAADSESALVSDRAAGYGLTGMRERAELLGGDLSAARTRRGYRVELRVPA
jgi:signal transduction histidine kinase